MRQFRIFHKRLILYVIFCFHVSLLLAYLLLNVDIISTTSRTSKRVSFFTKSSLKYVPLKKNTYHNYKDRIYLKKQSSDGEFIDFNTSICYRNGTDIKLMLHKEYNDKWNCKCLPTFHGNNCGQPEIIWRALLNFRKPINIKGPRKYKRNILFVIIADKFLTTALEIMISELNNVVDLFILIEYSEAVFLKNQLDNGFVKHYHKKILYLNITNESDLFSKIKNSVGNLKQETLIAFINENEILNKEGLEFLKLYDGWPEPLSFRLRWSVFGYYWLHPKKTVLKTNVFTFSYLNENWNHIKQSVLNSKRMDKFAYKEFIIGDLNHFGGWFCQFCYEPQTIISYLIAKNITSLNQQTIKIDQEYLEDLMGNGLYIDGKTELERVHRSNEHYYAPHFVIENKWNYDWLLTNIYSRLDY